MTQLSHTLYIVLFFPLFAISTVILLINITAKTPIPAWGGYLDVSIVVLIAFLGFLIYGRNKSMPRYDISYQVAIYLFPIILLSMWVYQDLLDFHILLPGAAWRTYFFLSILPNTMRPWTSEQYQ
jgi:hypothetical protein